MKDRNITDNTYSYFRYDDRDAVFVYINNTDEVPRFFRTFNPINNTHV